MLEKLIKESNCLFNYTDEVSIQYQNSSHQMLKYVNDSIKKESTILDLLGGNPFSLIDTNHENHIQFMQNIIKYKQSELLVNTLPWVYRTYSSKGIKFDYFKIELKHWIKAIEINIDRNYQPQLISIYNKMIDWHEDLIILSKGELVSDFKLDLIWTDYHEDILQALLTGDFNSLITQSSHILDNNMDVVEYYIQYLQPAMYKVGELWEKNKISIVHEHIATSTISRVMSSLYPNYILRQSNKGLAIVSAAANEFHQIGARMVADGLESMGWDVRYLGSNIPNEELIKIAEEIKPRFIALSVTMSYNIDKLIESVNMIRQNENLKHVKIMVGGLAINNQNEIKHLIAADAYPKDAKEASHMAEAWCDYGK